jgi:hypothetical protein
MVTLASLDNSITNAGNNTMEDHIVLCLARQKEVSNILSTTDYSSNTYVDDVTGLSFYAKEISRSLRSTFDVVAPNGILSNSYAISTYYNNNYQPVYDSTTFSLGSVNKNISIISPTTTLYASSLQITTQPNLGEFFDNSNHFGVTFDGSNANNNLQRALNSSYNTISNASPLYVHENVTFNTTYAMGQDRNNYYTVDSTTGAPVVNQLSSNNILTNNGFLIDSVNLDDFTLSQQGTYKIEQSTDNANFQLNSIVMKLDGVDLLDSVETPNLALSPLFNPTLVGPNLVGSTVSAPIPGGSLQFNEFQSLFDPAVDTPLPGYTFTVTMNAVENSGYNLTSGTTTLFSIDSSNLANNYAYMSEYVLGTHKLEFNSADLTIATSTNGYQSNITNFLSLVDGEETLEQSRIQNGKIVLYKQTPDQRNVVTVNTGNFAISDLDAIVFYPDEAVTYGVDGITNDIQTNEYVQYSVTPIIKTSLNNTYYATNNNAKLNFYSSTSGVINNRFNPGQITLNFNSTYAPSASTLEIFKISSQQQLVSINGFTEITSNIPVSSILAMATVSNLNTIATNTESYDSTKLLFNLKNVTDLSLINSATTAGWIANTTSSVLPSSSATALISDGNALPDKADVVNLLNGTYGSSSIYYNVALVSGSNSTSESSNLLDSIVISWGPSADNLSKSITIPQENLTRHNVGTPAINQTTVNPSSYTKTGILSSKNVSLTQFVSTRSYYYTFNLSLRGYAPIQFTTPTVSATTTYYLVYDNVMTQFYGNSYLRYITSTSSVNYSLMSESVTSSNPLTFNGQLTASDLQELSVTAYSYGSKDNNDDVAITNTSYISAFYGIGTTLTIIDQNQVNTVLTGDITVNLDYELFSFSTGQEVGLSLNSTSGYYIQCVSSYSTAYSVQSFTSTLQNLGSLNGSLTVDNGYSSITSWDSSTYSTSVAFVNNDTDTELSIIRNSDSAVMLTITMNDSSYLNTTSFVSYSQGDVYQVTKTIGDDAVNNSSTVSTVVANYVTCPVVGSITSNTNLNMFEIDSGVYVKIRNTVNFAIGDIYTFNLLADSIAVNMVGSTTSAVAPITSLSYQYVNGIYSSRVLNISNYRGYGGISGVNHFYTLQREELVATFSVTNSQNNVLSQSFDIYAGETVTVNNLVDNNGTAYGSIGLQFTFNYSMLSSSDTVNFPITVVGDNVTITAVNPQYANYNFSTITTTLKQYSLYTFSGSNFKDDGAFTNGPLRINSARVKMNNNDFSNHTSLQYTIQLASGTTNVYYVDNYLGNPANITNWGDSIFSGNYNDWLIGHTISTLNIKRTANSSYNASTSYIVIVPPYLSFVQRCNITPESVIPYNIASNTGNNLISHLPVVEANRSTSNEVYNPFVTHNVQYSDGTVVTITFNSTVTNDITVTNHESQSAYLYATASNNSNYNINVLGNYYTINLMLGLKDYPNTSVITELFSGVANTLLNETDNTQNIYLNRALSSNTGVVMNIIPSSEYAPISVNQIYATNRTIPSASVTLQLDSFFYNSSVTLDLPIMGQLVNLYTTKLSVDPLSGLPILNIYKYGGEYTVTGLSQVESITYTQRSIKQIPISAIAIAQSTPPNWSTMLSSITPASIPNVWSQDTSFTRTMTFSLVNLTSNAINIIPKLLLSSETNGSYKFTLVSRKNIFKVNNKIGMPLFSIDANGCIETQTVSTNDVSIASDTYTILPNDSLSNLALYSVLGYMNLIED